MEKTIVAISTPLGKGAISIVRLTGENSFAIADEVFCPIHKEEPKSRMMVLGHIELDVGKEKCFMVRFEAPKTYTGENMVEFQIHGGTIITQKILEKLIDCGAELAEPGEFSKRAFLNGKISLDEAESISEIISSESESELNISLNLAGGKLKKDITSLQNRLTELLAKIEVTLDYPEEDIDEVVREDVEKEICFCEKEIDELIKNGQNAKYIKNGIDVALLGETNVGKSSLLNAILGEDKAIVTNIAGTTRDIVEGTTFYKGIKLNFIDTAGIRETEDIVEKIGVEKSKSYLKNADIVLFVLDSTKKLDKQSREIIQDLKGKLHLIIVNKSDLKRELETIENEIKVSAKEKENIDLLEEKIYDMVIGQSLDFNKTIITNERHIIVLKECKEIIKQIRKDCKTELEVIDMLLKKLWNTLGKITGNTEHEDIVDMIFTKFCLGK